MVNDLLRGGGLRYNVRVISPGAQTERRGDAGPVSAWLGGEGSPAVSLCSSVYPAAGSRTSGDRRPQRARKNLPVRIPSIQAESPFLVGTLTRRSECIRGNAMTEPRKTVEQQQADPPRDPTEAVLSLEALGAQLLREEREGQAEFVTGWNEFMDQLGIQGEPIAARQLREMLLQEGVNPDDSAFSRGIIAMREE
jgi:hypothetical protein